MKTRIKLLVCVWVAGALFQACDTSNKIEMPASKYFTRYYSGVAHQRAVDMVVAPDYSTFILGTSTTITGDDQVYLAMADLQGNLVWQQELGGSTNEEARDLELTPDGLLVVVANVEEAASINHDVVIYIIDPASPMVPVHTRTYGYTGYDESANSITAITDGFLVAGVTTNVMPGLDGTIKPTNTSDGFVFRFNSDLSDYLATPWGERHGTESDPDALVRVFEGQGGAFYAFGHTVGLDADAVLDQNIWMFNLSQNGVEQNNVVIGNNRIPDTQATHDERLTSVTTIPGRSGFLLTGYTANPAAGTQRVLVMTVSDDFNKSDQILLTNPKIIGTTSLISEERAAGYARAGSFLIVGAENTNGDQNILLTKLNLDIDLTEAWASPRERFFLGGVGTDAPAAVAETHDDRILVLGTMMLGGATGQRKISLMKLSPRGMFGE